MLALLLAFLELNFIMVSILLLHRLKHTIGATSFYLALGMFMVFAQLVSAAGITIDLPWTDTNVQLGNTILLAPYMVAILVVYIVDGTLEAQRTIIGLLGILFAYFYLANITVSQFDLQDYSASNIDAMDKIQLVFFAGRRTMIASFFTFAVDLFVLPLTFQLVHNRIRNLLFCVLITLLFAQTIDTLVYHIISIGISTPNWWHQLYKLYIPRAITMIWLSLLCTMYLKMCNVHQRQGRGITDILVAFFGGYSRAMELQRYLHEWEGRYKIVVDNSSDFVFILDEQGGILNANTLACNGLSYNIGNKSIIGFPLTSILKDLGDEICDWDEIWDELNEAASNDIKVVNREWETVGLNKEQIYLDANISLAKLSEQTVAVIIARDITERLLMEEEHKKLQEELLHSQRLEAVGKLAAGVAHDFNNYLHTIQGSLDRLKQQWGLQPEHKAMLSNIEAATSRASTLTSQLLGFGRKGKYVLEKLDISLVMEHAKMLFQPIANKGLKFKMIIHPTTMYINGDSTQLQQVFLNLLINSRDATIFKKNEGKIVFRAEPAAEYTYGWNTSNNKTIYPDDYICVRIKDNGMGMPEEIQQKIFDPFFTTKGVGKGTGMGLAMVYGCIANHKGWIAVKSEVNLGTEFFIFLPRFS